MKAALLFAGSGPLVVLTSHASTTLLEKLGAKAIDKFIAYEIPLDLAQERYGNHFQNVLRDLHQADDLRIRDFNGQRAFGLFHLPELGRPILVENGRAGEAG